MHHVRSPTRSHARSKKCHFNVATWLATEHIRVSFTHPWQMTSLNWNQMLVGGILVHPYGNFGADQTPHSYLNSTNWEMSHVKCHVNFVATYVAGATEQRTGRKARTCCKKKLERFLCSPQEPARCHFTSGVKPVCHMCFLHGYFTGH